MNTTELRASFKHIHGYQDWQRQCEALADEIDKLKSLLRRALMKIPESESLFARDITVAINQ